MRPEKARQIINNTIQRYLHDDRTAMYLPDMLRACNSMYVKQAIWHEENGFVWDTPVDLDTDYNSVTGELEYISDRWNNLQRLEWLITGIKEHKF